MKALALPALMFCGLIAGCASAPASNNNTVVPANSTASATETPADKLVCTTETQMGSNIPHRVCMTQGERDQNAKASKDALYGFRQTGNYKPTGQ